LLIEQHNNGRTPVTRIVLPAAGAFALALFVLSSGAQAQCWWTGLGPACAVEPVFPQTYWGSPYAAFTPYDYRDYRYKPAWLPSYPGPRPGGP
jgi:hypothetical protein